MTLVAMSTRHRSARRGIRGRGIFPKSTIWVRQHAEIVVESLVVAIDKPLFGMLAYFGKVVEDARIHTSCRKLPLKHSIIRFFLGRPGSMKSKAISLRSTHSNKISVTNFGLLSTRSLAG